MLVDLPQILSAFESDSGGPLKEETLIANFPRAVLFGGCTV